MGRRRVCGGEGSHEGHGVEGVPEACRVQGEGQARSREGPLYLSRGVDGADGEQRDFRGGCEDIAGEVHDSPVDA